MFGVQKDDISRALTETQSIKAREKEEEKRSEDERRQNFRPYIYIETFSNMPRQICFFAISGGQATFIKLSDAFLGLDKDRAIRIVSWLVRRHYKRSHGEAEFFGPIKGYRFIRTFEENILYDTEGRVLGVVQERITLPFSCSFSLGRRQDRGIHVFEGN